ncbi:hypothetical protein [Leptothermofonsia sp. ETS-13]|uniref:hypothetical protein n=1 Tax=Leptothermofonsia sp. ETS-13 TaxID=3035696 RepID=UPI003B9E885C
MSILIANSDEFSKRSGWLIATRLSVGFLSIVCLVALLSPWETASANPVILAQTAKPGIPAQADAIAQKMLGQWLTKELLAGDMVMFVFAPNGKAFLISGKAPDGKPLARAIQYSINSKARPMHLPCI